MDKSELPYTLAELAPIVREVKHYMTGSAKVSRLPKVGSSNDAFQLLRPLFAENMEYREQMEVLLINRANRVIGHKTVSIGGVSGTVADPKIIFQAALALNASGIILAHNHPSGNMTASQSDIDLTRKVKAGGTLLEIQLLDHLIISQDRYFSFVDEGML